MKNNKTTILAAFTHPDDELFVTGGTLAMYAAEGVNAVLVCGARGEAGEVLSGLFSGL